MIVYVESNFVLELALEQEQYKSCEEIISICESDEVNLVIPAFCIAEPYETLGRCSHERTQLKTSLASVLRLLSRSQLYQHEVNALQGVSNLLIRSIEDEEKRLHNTLDRILKIAEIIPLEQKILTAAAQFQSDFGLKPPDAIVYASVSNHLKTTGTGNKCFLNRNSRDFDDPDIESELSRYGCKMLFRFDSGSAYIKQSQKKQAHENI